MPVEAKELRGGFNPRFKQLWAPIDGRVLNLSMMIKW